MSALTVGVQVPTVASRKTTGMIGARIRMVDQKATCTSDSANRKSSGACQPLLVRQGARQIPTSMAASTVAYQAATHHLINAGHADPGADSSGHGVQNRNTRNRHARANPGGSWVMLATVSYTHLTLPTKA